MKLIFLLLVFIFLIIFTIYFLPNIGQFQKQIHSPSPLPQQKENSSKSPSHPLEPTGDISRLPSPLPKLTGDINKFPLTYMQASKYKGPIVEGWPPERNRLLDLYIRPKEDTFYMTPTSKAIKNCKFLIMIHTLPDFFESRTGIRNTYGRYLSEKLAGNTSLLFIIGNLKKSNNDNYERTWYKLKKEQEIFGDILQVSTPIFGYDNLRFCLKICFQILRWAHSFSSVKDLSILSFDRYFTCLYKEKDEVYMSIQINNYSLEKSIL